MKVLSFFKLGRTSITLLPGLLALLLTSCYPDQPEFVEEYDVVYTNYSPDYDFNTSYTYSLPDRVLLIDEDRDPGDPPEFIDDQFSDAILDNLRKNFNAQGWTEVDEDDDPERIILASAFDTTFAYFYNPGYWCWYYPCWGWGYPGYNPGYVTGYQTGTVLVQMTDPNGVQNNEVPVIWTGTLNGLLQGSDANIIGRIDRNLDQAFDQPPFANN
jgi:hypothetical protein